MVYSKFEQPIKINTFYFNREIFEFLQSVEDLKIRLALYENFVYWALNNECNPNPITEIPSLLNDKMNELVASTTYAGLNKYRWDFYHGKQGGRPKRENKFF